MVNFNSDATIGTPRTDILSITILQRRYDLFEALEQYRKAEYHGGSAPDYAVRARLFSLFMEVRASLKNDMSAEEFSALVAQVQSKEKEEWSAALVKLDDWLYRKNLTKVDTRKATDPRDVEATNRDRGF